MAFPAPAAISESSCCASPWRAWAMLIPAMAVPLVDSLFYFVFLTDPLAARAVYGFAKMFLVLWPLLAWAVIGTGWRSALRLLGYRFSVLDAERIVGCGKRTAARRPSHVGDSHWEGPRVADRALNTYLRGGRPWPAVAFGALSGTAIGVLVLAALHTPLGAALTAASGGIRAKMALLGVLDHYWTFALFLSIVHSLVEEYYWRGFVFGGLSRLLPLPAAHLLAAAAFASHHGVVISQLFSLAWGVVLGCGVAAGGLIWSLMVVRQRTLLGAWVSHFLVDMALMAAGHWMLFGALC